MGPSITVQLLPNTAPPSPPSGGITTTPPQLGVFGDRNLLQVADQESCNNRTADEDSSSDDDASDSSQDDEAAPTKADEAAPTKADDSNQRATIKMEVDSSDSDEETRYFRSSPELSESFKALNTNDGKHSYCSKIRHSPRSSELTSKPYDNSSRKEELKQEPAKSEAVDDALPTIIPKQEKNYLQIHLKLVNFITNVVCLDTYVESECYNDAMKLSQVAVIMTKNNQLHKFVEVFAHSVSCSNTNCNNTCRMFRRIRSHVSNASHRCALMNVYSQLLRMHIDSCVLQNCGLNACKAMLATRLDDQLSVLPRNFQKVEQVIGQKLYEENVKEEKNVKCCKNEDANDIPSQQSPPPPKLKCEPVEICVPLLSHSKSAPNLPTCCSLERRNTFDAPDLSNKTANGQVQACG